MRVISSSPSPSGPSSSRGGGTFWMSVTSPSASAMIRFSSRGVTRTGSRKNASTQTVNMIKGHVSQGTKSHASTAIAAAIAANLRSEEHTSELQSLMRISYAVFCLKKKNKDKPDQTKQNI